MRKFLKEWAPVIGLMLLAGVLRLYELGSWPPGLYHDEAWNGLDALRVLAGDRPLYFAANHGREPFFIYLVALSVGWLGRSVYAIRFPATIIGILTIPATYWMARQLFGRRIGLIAAAVMTIALWPIHLSLIGFRAVSLPLFIALSIATGVRAYRSGRVLDWLIAGVIYGASFYTYLSSRFTPFVLAITFILIIAAHRGKRLWPGVVVFALTVAVVLTPLAITAYKQWDVVMGRPGDISIFNSALNHGDVIGTAVRSTLNALGMFFWQGDRIPRHNVPYRPVFDPILAVMFVLGLLRLIIGAIRSRPPAAQPLPDFLKPGPDFQYRAQAKVSTPPQLPSLFTLIWIVVMLLPTILAEDSPHFLRAVGVLPVAMMIPAIGLDAVAQWLANRGWRVLGTVVIVVAIIIAGAWTIGDYSRYAADPETAFAFEAAGTDLAASARASILSGQRVFIADRFNRDWTSLSFLLGGSYETIPDGAQPPINKDTTSTLFVWPYEDWAKALKALSAPMTVRATAGPMAKGDLDPQPHVGYLQVQVEPQRSVSAAPEARFDNGVRLLGHSIEAIDDQHWRLRTLWQSDGTITDDQTFFVHLLLAGQLVATKDGDSGDGFYPMKQWRPGDVIIDERIIDVPAQADRVKLLIEMGIYDRATNQRAKVLEAAQAIIDNAVLLGGPSANEPNAVGP